MGKWKRKRGKNGGREGKENTHKQGEGVERDRKESFVFFFFFFFILLKTDQDLSASTPKRRAPGMIVQGG